MDVFDLLQMKLIGGKDLYEEELLEKEEKTDYLKKQVVSSDVLEYLKDCLQNLTIEFRREFREYVGNILYLMTEGYLEGWCWETTASAICFFQDKDYINRGYLKFSEHKDYYHSWIVFTYDGEEYVFDPCLNILCKKEMYDKVFEVNVLGGATAKQVREYLLQEIEKQKTKEFTEGEKIGRDFFKSIAPNEFERQQKETRIKVMSEDINHPMYENYTGYIAEVEEGQIRKLKAHYYDKSIEKTL